MQTYKPNTETIHSYDDSLENRIKTIKELIILGAKNQNLIDFANKIRFSKNIYKDILNYAYDNCLMTLTPENRQQFRTVRNMLISRRANCTGYTTLIGSLLTILKIPFTMRVTGLTFDELGQPEYTHIYIVANGFVMDATIGQDPYGNATFGNRKKSATFNTELGSLFHKDFNVNMNTVLNGQTKNLNAIDPMTMKFLEENYTDANGKIDIDRATADVRKVLDLGVYGVNTIASLYEQYLNPCKRGCDIKHPWNFEKRTACKRQCTFESLQKMTPQELQRIMNVTSAQTGLLQNNNVLIVGGLLAFAYFYNQNR